MKKAIISGLIMLLVGLAVGVNLIPPKDIVTVTEEPSKIVRKAPGKLPLKDKGMKKMFTIEGANVIKFTGEVTSESVINVMNLIKLAQGSKRPILLTIDSPGGSVFAGLKLIDIIRTSKVPVITLVTGVAASMGAYIHQAGHVRLMAPNSVLMFHPVSGGAMGTFHEMSTQLEAVGTIQDRLMMETAVRSGVDFNLFKLKVIENLWLNADEAYTTGLSDGYAVDTTLDIPPEILPLNPNDRMKLKNWR